MKFLCKATKRADLVQQDREPVSWIYNSNSSLLTAIEKAKSTEFCHKKDAGEAKARNKGELSTRLVVHFPSKQKDFILTSNAIGSILYPFGNGWPGGCQVSTSGFS